MKIEFTEDSPILIKLIPETPLEAFKNNNIFSKLNKNKRVKLKKNNTLLINIDQCGWSDFKEH